MEELMSVENLPRSVEVSLKQHKKKTEAALAENQTPVSREAGENCTTEPPTPALIVIDYRCL